MEFSSYGIMSLNTFQIWHLGIQKPRRTDALKCVGKVRFRKNGDCSEVPKVWIKTRLLLTTLS